MNNKITYIVGLAGCGKSNVLATMGEVVSGCDRIEHIRNYLSFHGEVKTLLLDDCDSLALAGELDKLIESGAVERIVAAVSVDAMKKLLTEEIMAEHCRCFG